MTKITYGDKTPVVPQVSHSTQWWAEDINETKSVVNANDTVDTDATATVLFDQVTGYRHGTWGTPITGDITLDETGAVEGGVAVVIWRGSSNPTYLGGGTIQSEAGVITIDGKYSIYIHYINGRFNINIFNVTEPGAVALFEDDFTGSTIDTAKWDVTIPTPANYTITQSEILILTPQANINGTVLENNVRGDDAITLSDIEAVSFDIVNTDQTNNYYQVGLTKDATPSSNIDKIVVNRTITAGNTQIVVRDTSVNTLQTDVVLDLSTIKTFKITNLAGTIEFWYWNGSWITMGSVAHTLVGNWYPVIGGRDDTSASGDVRIDNFYVSDTDFSTQRPA